MSDPRSEFRGKLLNGALRMRADGFHGTAEILETLLQEELWGQERGHHGFCESASAKRLTAGIARRKQPRR